MNYELGEGGFSGFAPLAGYVQTQFPDAVPVTGTAPGQSFLSVPVPVLVDLCRFLRDDERLFFDLLACITAIDNGPDASPGKALPGNAPPGSVSGTTGAGTMEVFYNLTSIPYEHNLMLRVTVPRQPATGDLPELPSLSHLWRTADWHEREAYDLLGIRFTNHPDLRRILLPTDWIGHPLRTDYTEPDQYHGIRTD
jgi:NADH-quinone oxidoreductase subunit C